MVSLSMHCNAAPAATFALLCTYHPHLQTEYLLVYLTCVFTCVLTDTWKTLFN